MLEHIAVDHLTGFLSREPLNRFLQEAMLEAASERKSLFITLVDLDHFKRFNDRFGHVFGDEILRYAAEVLRSTLGETSNYFFRYGGDEFIVVSVDKKVSEMMRSLRKYNSGTYYQPFISKGRSYKITLSAGISIFPRDAQTVDELIKKADKAMYFSKRHGRRTVTLAGRMLYVFLADVIIAFVVGIAIAYLSIYLFYNQPSIINDAASYYSHQLRSLRIFKPGVSPGIAPVRTSTLDIVKLKDGTVYEGRILVNGAEEIIISVKSQETEYIKSIPASKIDSIKHGIAARPDTQEAK